MKSHLNFLVRDPYESSSWIFESWEWNTPKSKHHVRWPLSLASVISLFTYHINIRISIYIHITLSSVWCIIISPIHVFITIHIYITHMSVAWHIMIPVAPRPPASSYSADFRSELEDSGLCCDDLRKVEPHLVWYEKVCKRKGVQ